MRRLGILLLLGGRIRLSTALGPPGGGLKPGAESIDLLRAIP
jgi:hypothetical protein